MLANKNEKLLFIQRKWLELLISNEIPADNKDVIGKIFLEDLGIEFDDPLSNSSSVELGNIFIDLNCTEKLPKWNSNLVKEIFDLGDTYSFSGNEIEKVLEIIEKCHMDEGLQIMELLQSELAHGHTASTFISTEEAIKNINRNQENSIKREIPEGNTFTLKGFSEKDMAKHLVELINYYKFIRKDYDPKIATNSLVNYIRVLLKIMEKFGIELPVTIDEATREYFLVRSYESKSIVETLKETRLSQIELHLKTLKKLWKNRKSDKIIGKLNKLLQGIYEDCVKNINAHFGIKDNYRKIEDNIKTNSQEGQEGFEIPKKEAKENLNAGITHYNANRYDEALGNFNKAYTIYQELIKRSSDPKNEKLYGLMGATEFYIGSVYKAQQNYPSAIECFQRAKIDFIMHSDSNKAKQCAEQLTSCSDYMKNINDENVASKTDKNSPEFG